MLEQVVRREGAERVQSRCQVAHDTPLTARSDVRILPQATRLDELNPQLRGLIHRFRR
jgi:hypothetical protein